MFLDDIVSPLTVKEARKSGADKWRQHFDKETAASREQFNKSTEHYNRLKTDPEYREQQFQKWQQQVHGNKQINELFEPQIDYYTLSNGKMVQASYRPGPNLNALPGSVSIEFVDPKLKPQGGSFNSTGQASPWDRAPDGVKQEIMKFVKQQGQQQPAPVAPSQQVAQHQQQQGMAEDNWHAGDNAWSSDKNLWSESMDESEPSPVASAVTRRILSQRLDLLKQYGPELVGAAVDNVADYVGDVEEIGSSDVSAWVAQVERMLQDNPPEAFAESVTGSVVRRVGAGQAITDEKIRQMVWDLLKIKADTGEQAIQRALSVLADKTQSSAVQNLQDRLMDLKLQLARGVVQEQGVDEGVNDPHIFKCIFLFGPMGAGKSTVARPLLSHTGLRSVNLDNFNEMFIKQGQVPTGHLSPDQLEKSWQLSQTQQQNFVDGRLGIIIDGSGRNPNTATSVIEKLMPLGYEFMMIFVNVSEATSIARQQSRANAQQQKWGVGRQVDPTFAKDTYAQVQQNLGRYSAYFGRERFVYVDNENTPNLAQATKQVDAFLRAPVTQPEAIQWIQAQQGGQQVAQQQQKLATAQDRQQQARKQFMKSPFKPSQSRPIGTRNYVEDEGDAEGLPHLTKKLLQHIVQQVGKEGAHAIVKSLEWGDGAAEELLALLLKDLKADISDEEIDECLGSMREAKKNSHGHTSKQQSAIAMAKQGVAEEWSQKYKSSINCSHPKGFSQKAHCAGKRKHNESIEMEMTCPDCGMCQTHGTLNEIKKGEKDSNGYTKCWPGKHAEGTKKGKNGGQVRNCEPNESVAEALGTSPDKLLARTGMNMAHKFPRKNQTNLGNIPGMNTPSASPETKAFADQQRARRSGDLKAAIRDQLGNHRKPNLPESDVTEGGPYDLPGKDYDRPGDTPRKQSSGEHNPYPYSPEEDNDYFREIFRKKREAAAKAKAQGSSLNELSNDKLASYKKDASADATAADKRGDYERGNKRFRGIVKATIKQGDNDAKKHKKQGMAEAIPLDTLRSTAGTRVKDEVSAKLKQNGPLGRDAEKAKQNGKPVKPGVAEGSELSTSTLTGEIPTAMGPRKREQRELIEKYALYNKERDYFELFSELSDKPMPEIYNMNDSHQLAYELYNLGSQIASDWKNIGNPTFSRREYLIQIMADWYNLFKKSIQKYKSMAQGVAEGSTGLSIQQLATISDEALDNAYHYGRSTPGNTFGWQANLASAAYAKRAIEKGVTDLMAISDAVHKGWWSVAQKFVDNPDQFSDTETLRAKGKFDKKMADRKAQMVPFNRLTKDQQDIDTVVARAMLQAITGDQGVAEGVVDTLKGAWEKIRDFDEPGRYKGGNTRRREALRKKLELQKKQQKQQQGVAEAVDIGQEWMSDTELDQYVPDQLQQQWRELLGYDRNGNPSALWANLTGGYEPDVRDPQHRALMVKVANKWFAAKKIPNIKFFDVKDADDELEWLVQIGKQGMAESTNYWNKLQETKNKKIANLMSELTETIKDIK